VAALVGDNPRAEWHHGSASGKNEQLPTRAPSFIRTTLLKIMTITEAQKGRLWGIALDNGYTSSGVFELVNDYGYEKPEEVERDDYDEICRVAGDPVAAEEFNRKAGRDPVEKGRPAGSSEGQREVPNRPHERSGGRQIRDHRMS